MRGKPKKKIFLSITAVLVLVIIFHGLGWLSSIEQHVRGLFIPASDTLYSWSVGAEDNVEKFESVESLEQAYADLRKRHLSLMVDRSQLLSLQEENRTLRSQLKFTASSTAVYIGAEVVGKRVDPLGSTVVVNVGDEHGVRIGYPVISGEGVFIGTVAESRRGSAVVRLLNDNQSRIAATLHSQDKSIGILEGQHGISMQMNFIPQNERVDIGDIMITSGLQESIPYGLPIGTVSQIEREPYQPFQVAQITSLVNLDKLRIVSVLIP